MSRQATLTDTREIATPMAGPLLGLRPVLDVARRTAAGFEAIAAPGAPAGNAAAAALGARSTLPPNTFLTLTPDHAALADRSWLVATTAPGDLSGVVVHVDDPEGLGTTGLDHLRVVREAGALLSTGNRDRGQPTLRTIADLRPAIVRLGRDWVRGTDVDADKRHAVATTGRVASQLDAWILADDVRSADELVALAELAVPLAQGPIIGEVAWPWPAVSAAAHRALRALRGPARDRDRDDSLRELLQRACTTPQDRRTTAEAARAGYDVTVVLDGHGRPVALLVLRGGGWVTQRPFTVNVDTSPAQALERARHRTPGHEDAPLVCTDTAGRFCGVLRQDRLAAHVAANRS